MAALETPIAKAPFTTADSPLCPCVVEMTGGVMTAMFQMDEIASGTKMSKGGTDEVPVEAMIKWNNAKKDKWASNNN